MVETRYIDSLLYYMTTPDVNSGGILCRRRCWFIRWWFDSNYSATYWPWVQINDTENNVLIYVPPTRDVVRNIASQIYRIPWFAAAGINRGDVDAIKARKN
jgi:hypothetical protein